jgi:hypothetical protein
MQTMKSDTEKILDVASKIIEIAKMLIEEPESKKIPKPRKEKPK